MSTHVRSLVLIGLTLAPSLAACTANRFTAAGREFETSTTSVTTAAHNQFLPDDRSFYRDFLLEKYPDLPLASWAGPLKDENMKAAGRDFLCQPLGRYAEQKYKTDEVASLGAQIHYLLAKDEAPSLASLAVRAGRDYDTGWPKPKDDAVPNSQAAFDQTVRVCVVDFNLAYDRNAYIVAFTDMYPLEYGTTPKAGITGAIAGLQTIWSIAEPILLKILTLVDDYRRGEAVRAIFADPANREKLNEHIGDLRKVATRVSMYRRVDAMKTYWGSFQKFYATPSAKRSGDTLKTALITSVSGYEKEFSAALDDPILKYVKAVQRIQDVADGKGSEEDLIAAINDLKNTTTAVFEVIKNIDALSNDPATKKRLDDAAKQIARALGQDDSKVSNTGNDKGKPAGNASGSPTPKPEQPAPKPKEGEAPAEPPTDDEPAPDS